jgi:protein tyrosine/serine phosphatase
MRLDGPGCANARDVGGLPTVDGSWIRAGALLRSDHHFRLTPATVRAIRGGVSRIIDLRWARECAAEPSPFAGDPIYRHIPMFGDVLDYEILPDTYGPMLDHNQTRIAAAFIAVAEAPPGGVIVHCHGGRDRTGALVALALTVAGVGAETVADEYALSAGTVAVAMLNTLGHTDRRCGGVAPYLRSIGVRQHQIDAVRSRLRPSR